MTCDNISEAPSRIGWAVKVAINLRQIMLISSEDVMTFFMGRHIFDTPLDLPSKKLEYSNSLET